MRRASVVWLASIALCGGSSLLANAGQPATKSSPNIVNARWVDYKDMYPTSLLCKAHDITIWTCNGKEKTYSLCSSQEITKDSGYMQYRAGSDYEATFRFPERKRHPKGFFKQHSSPNGDASVTFQNDNYNYTLIDRLRDTSSILVSKESDGNAAVHISCRNASQSLQLNYTLKLMELSGVVER